MNLSTTITASGERPSVMLKACISWRARRIPLSYGRHCPGQITLSAITHTVEYESQLERDAIVFLAESPGFRFVQTQPFTLKYTENGRRRRYTPDLLVVLDPVSATLRRLGFEGWTIVEVKPRIRLDAEASEVADLLSKVHEATGLATVCLTEREIRSGGRLS